MYVQSVARLGRIGDIQTGSLVLGRSSVQVNYFTIFNNKESCRSLDFQPAKLGIL